MIGANMQRISLLLAIAFSALAALSATVAHGAALQPTAYIQPRDAAPSLGLQLRHGDEEHHILPLVKKPDASEEELGAHTYHSATPPHAHAHTPSSYDGVADAAHAGAAMIDVPALAHVQHGHAHHGHGGAAPLQELNETTLLRWKGPEPLSYVEWDFAYGIGKKEELQRFVRAYDDDRFVDLMGVSDGMRYRRLVDESDDEARKSVILDLRRRVRSTPDAPGRHRTVLLLHVVGCILSCFVLLPAALALRAASSGLAPLASSLYLVTLAASLFCSVLYKAMTPRLYPSNAHSGVGWAVFWISLAALGGDALRLLRTAIAQLRSSERTHAGLLLRALKTVTPSHYVSDEDAYDAHEEQRMLDDARPHRSQQRQGSSGSSGLASPSRSVHFEQEDQHHEYSRRSSTVRSWRNALHSPTSTLLGTPRTSVTGDATWTLSADKLHDDDDDTPTRSLKRFGLLGKFLRYSHVTVARSLPLLAFAAAYTGLAVYTGSCRAPYKNGCLAHGIKGGIFFWYGLLSFARYLGAYADRGWAWNRKPGSSRKGNDGVSAEWVECFVIFLYGATNMWMERMGAQAGDPYTVKQVQHISIAVMFCFAGLMGLALETKSLKSLLAFPVALKQAASMRRSSSHDQEDIATRLPAPPSYGASFNPFPALVIGVTGVAMAAHHQDYAYQVAVHALWGNLLAAFSVLRTMTYVFLWLRPPTSSVLPSRPPTEALASFCLTCGGLVFMLSSEEVSFAAMRNSFGDLMMILNATVAIVSLLLCATTALMVLKAWAVKREHRRNRRNLSQHPQLASTSETASTFVIGADDDDDDSDEKRRQVVQSPEPA